MKRTAIFLILAAFISLATTAQPETQPVVGDVVVVYGDAVVTGADEVFPGVWVPSFDAILSIEPAGSDPVLVKSLYCNEGIDAEPPTITLHVVENRVVQSEVQRQGRWIVRDDEGAISQHDRLDQAIESATSSELMGRDCWIVPPERFEVSLQTETVWVGVSD